MCKPLSPSDHGRRTLKGFALAAIFGILIGGLLEFLAVVLAGGGHGTFLPFALFFGPVIGPFGLIEAGAERLGSDVQIFGAKPSRWGFSIAFCGGGVLLYGLYAVVIHRARRHGAVRAVPWILLLLHHILGVVALTTLVPEDWRAARKLLSGNVIWWTLASTVAYVGTHLIAVFCLWARRRVKPRGFPVVEDDVSSGGRRLG